MYSPLHLPSFFQYVPFDSFIQLMKNGQNGWKFNPSISQTKQFGLYFTNPYVDIISKTLTAFGSVQHQRIVYLGARYTSSIKNLKAFASNPARESNDLPNAEIYSQNQIERYQIINNQRQRYYPPRPSEYRLFMGMNPTASSQQLIFDSNFECGNLDLVVSLGDMQYDLFMRVDSNTKGHTCWFFFKVSNFKHHQRVKFNIVNFSRSQLLYQSGMGIYLYTSSSKEWVQGGENIEFMPSKKCVYTEKQHQGDRLFTLSFEYQFKSDQFVYFAYCVPYSYSLLEHRLKELEKKYSKILEVDRSNTSTGGIPIPVITFTNNSISSIRSEGETIAKKEYCLIIGRLHPGEPQGSWLMDGFLRFLCSSKSKQLRNRISFKIIPMVNVDGVIVGNFRTGLLGRDLNRCFHQPEIYSEIALVRSLASQIKPIIFIDFHGHSSKKNIFTYGPDYTIDDRYFIPTRLFPKAISKSTSSFRYYACQFRIPQDKKMTGRAVMLRKHQIPYSFTLEASAFAYGPKRQEILFNMAQFQQSGARVCEGLDTFTRIILAPSKRAQNQQSQTLKNTQAAKKLSIKNLPQKMCVDSMSGEDKKILQEILSDEHEFQRYEKEVNKQIDSDFQQNNDYTELQLNKMLNQPTENVFSTKEKVTKKKLLTKGKEIYKQLHSQKCIIQDYETKTQVNEATHSLRPPNSKRLPQMSPPLTKVQSQSFDLQNDFNYLPQKVNTHVHKIQLQMSRKIFSEDSCLIMEDPYKKLKSLNHISLDYSLNKASKQYQPLSESKKARQKASNLIRRRNRDFDKIVKVQQPKKEDILEVKQSLLPLLGRSGNMNKQDCSSMVQQLLQNHERARNKRVSRRIKIFYY